MEPVQVDRLKAVFGPERDLHRLTHDSRVGSGQIREVLGVDAEEGKVPLEVRERFGLVEEVAMEDLPTDVLRAGDDQISGCRDGRRSW